MPFIYKSSYDKANRSSIHAYRGPGLEEGLRILRQGQGGDRAAGAVRRPRGRREVAPAAEVLDVLQIPAFLCRQTDLIVACARSGRPVNVKKGQFLAPRDMVQRGGEGRASAGSEDILLTERGTSFGYNNLVVDFRGLPIMRGLRLSGGLRRHALGAAAGRAGGSLGRRARSTCRPLARAAVAVGVDGLFMEIHEDPDRTLDDGGPLSDGPNMLRLDDLPRLLDEIRAIAAGPGRA